MVAIITFDDQIVMIGCCEWNDENDLKICDIFHINFSRKLYKEILISNVGQKLL